MVNAAIHADETMDKTAVIAASFSARNAASIHDAQAEDAFYNTLGKDHLADLKSALSRARDVLKEAKIYLRVPARTHRQRA